VAAQGHDIAHGLALQAGLVDKSAAQTMPAEKPGVQSGLGRPFLHDPGHCDRLYAGIRDAVAPGDSPKQKALGDPASS
jgi:hypothetical protein